MQWNQCLRTESTYDRHQISITSLLTTPHYQFRVLGRPPYPAYVHTYKVNGERSLEIAGSGTAGCHFQFPPHSFNNPRWSVHIRTYLHQSQVAWSAEAASTGSCRWLLLGGAECVPRCPCTPQHDCRVDRQTDRHTYTRGQQMLQFYRDFAIQCM